MLNNPCYAGAFAYGKTAARTGSRMGEPDKARVTGNHKMSGKCCLLDHHPGYISWEEYLENQKRLEANVAWSGSEGSGAAKLGSRFVIRLTALRSMWQENASCLQRHQWPRSTICLSG